MRRIYPVRKSYLVRKRYPEIKCYLMIKVTEVTIVKEVKRSDGLWRFACGDVFNWPSDTTCELGDANAIWWKPAWKVNSSLVRTRAVCDVTTHRMAARQSGNHGSELLGKEKENLSIDSLFIYAYKQQQIKKNLREGREIREIFEGKPEWKEVIFAKHKKHT